MTTAPDPRAAAPIARARAPTLAYAVAAALWFALVAPLAWWGLPSSASDDLLFGGDAAWPTERYAAADALRQRSERVGGADTDLNPIGAITAPTELTGSLAQRAEILRRYRLFSRQPDEMITFMALQRMKPGVLDLDPRQYQYGGAYIYLVGAAIGAGSLVGVTTLTSDVGAYLQQPALFARFYLVSRFLSLAFAAGLLIAVARIAERFAGALAGWAALLLIAAAPVFLSGALEAKPHVSSACLLAWATLAALSCRDDAGRRNVIRLGVLAGLALGMVLTGLAAALLWPGLLLRHRRDGRALRRLLAGGALALGVYVATNPYVPYNLLTNRAALTSNLNNSLAMYSLERFGDGAARVAALALESCGAGVCVLGALGLIFVSVRGRGGELATGALPALGMLALCGAIGADKPAEFARFLLWPSAWLCVGAATLIGGSAAGAAGLLRTSGPSADLPAALARGWPRVRATLGLAVCILLMDSRAYIGSFWRDAGGADESRRRAGEFVRDSVPQGAPIGVLQEPAPYAIPPLDFTRRRILLLPPSAPPELAVSELPPWLVLTADDDGSAARGWWRAHYEFVRRFPPPHTQLSPITWADKPVYVYRRAAP